MKKIFILSLLVIILSLAIFTLFTRNEGEKNDNTSFSILESSKDNAVVIAKLFPMSDGFLIKIQNKSDEWRITEIKCDKL